MRKLVAGLAVMVVFLFFITRSFSASQWEVKDIKAAMGNISIKINGELLETKTEPFILQEQGVTMVPLRELSQALGFIVQWDENTASIIITGNPVSNNTGRDKYWAGSPKDKLENLSVIRNIGPFYQKKTRKYQIAGRYFDFGVAVDIDQSNTVSEIVVDLSQKYSTFEGFFGVDDETMNSRGGYRLTILGDNRVLFTSDVVKPSDFPRNFEPGEINLSYVNRLTFKVEWGEVGIGDYDKITAALGDFNFYLKEATLSNNSTFQAGSLAGQTKIIIVQAGDTLFSLSQKNYTTVENLLKLNPSLDPNLIKVGQAIKVPSP